MLQEVALATGVLLDPVYSGKALHSLLAGMRAQPQQWQGKKVLFVHTGGLLVSMSAAVLLLAFQASVHHRQQLCEFAGMAA